jgi:hypothetical protein
MLPTLIAAAGVRVTRVAGLIAAVIATLIPGLITIGVRAGSLRMILRRMRRWMRRLHALLPELARGIHAPCAGRPLRGRRLRAQQQHGRKKQPDRQRE